MQLQHSSVSGQASGGGASTVAGPAFRLLGLEYYRDN